MADGKVIIAAYLDAKAVKSGIGEVKAALNNLRNAEGKIDFKGITKNARQLDGVSAAFKGLGKTLTAGVTVPIAAAGAAALKMASDNEDAFAKVKTIANPADLPYDAIKKQITDLSNESGVSFAELSEATYQAISAGQSAGNAVGFVSQAVKLARAGFTDTASATDVMSTALNAYGLEADKAAHVSDVLLMTQNKGKTSVAELASNMGRVIPTAAAFGVSLEQLSAAYATTTANGIATAESTTYISSMLNELGKSGTKAADLLKSATGQSFKEMMDGGASLADVLGVLKGECDKSGMSFADLFGSAEAGKAAMALMEDGGEKLRENLDAVSNSSGATDSAFEQMETSSHKVGKALNAAGNATASLGETLLVALAPVIETVANAVQNFAQWFQGLPEPVQQFIAVLGVLAAAVGPVLMAIGMIAPVVTGITAALGVGLAPVIGIVAGIALAIAAVVVVVQNWGAITEAVGGVVSSVWQGVCDFVSSVWQGAVDGVTGIIQGLAEFMQGAWDGIRGVIETVLGVIGGIIQTLWGGYVAFVTAYINTILTIVTTVWNAISGVISTVLGVISGVISSVWNGICGIVQGVLGTIQGVITSVWGGIQGIIQGVMGTIQGVISSVWNAISGVISGVLGGISGVVSGIFNGVKNTIQGAMTTAWNVVKGAIDKIVGFFTGCRLELPKIKLPHFSISGSFSLNPPSIPSIGVDWYAKGGVFNSASIIGVGERGAEAVVPLTSRRMLPFAQAVADGIGASNGGGDNITFNIQATIREDADIRRIADEIQRRINITKRARG